MATESIVCLLTSPGYVLRGCTTLVRNSRNTTSRHRPGSRGWWGTRAGSYRRNSMAGRAPHSGGIYRWDKYGRISGRNLRHWPFASGSKGYGAVDQLGESASGEYALQGPILSTQAGCLRIP